MSDSTNCVLIVMIADKTISLYMISGRLSVSVLKLHIEIYTEMPVTLEHMATKVTESHHRQSGFAFQRDCSQMIGSIIVTSWNSSFTLWNWETGQSVRLQFTDYDAYVRPLSKIVCRV